MLLRVVIYCTLVYCVSSNCDEECKQMRSYTRVKRGKYYSSAPTRFYSRPPITIPIKGPFSYTPPPVMGDDEPFYPRRPYKVSKRPPPSIPSNDGPSYDGLGDEDISNLVKHLSKQDLDKILEFAQGKDQGYDKYKDVHNTNEFTWPAKRESRIVYKGNLPMEYEEPAPYKEPSNIVNYVTEPNYVKVFRKQVHVNPKGRPSQAQFDSFSPNNEANNYVEILPSNQVDINSAMPVGFPASVNPMDASQHVNNYHGQPARIEEQFMSEGFILNQRIPNEVQHYQPTHAKLLFNRHLSPPVLDNAEYTDSNEEEKLPPPVNMRQEDYEASHTNNVPKIVKAGPDSYEVENFGDLPLMDYYNSKLHDVSSYHVPHYTVTQPKPSKPASSVSPSVSIPSYYPMPSSPLLKPSPAAEAIKEPVYERAPPASAAAEQSDAHLKAIKIWSHKSQGAAYTLNDDGTLTPERNKPKYG